MTKRIHANNAVTLLDGTITAIATSLTVIDSSKFPAIGAGETFRLTLQASTGEIEIVEVTSASLAPTLTVTRGMEGTTGFAFPNGSLVSLRTTKDSHDRKQDQIANSSDVIDFGAATSLEIPNSATPSITVSGQIALDTTVTDYADGVVCYQAGATVYGIVAVPLSGLASPIDSYVVTYDAATDKFKLAATAIGYTDEQAQDAIGAMVDTTLEYVDATPILRRAALTGDVTASAGSNATTVALPASATVAANDKVYIFDTDASDAKKYVTAQSIRELSSTNDPAYGVKVTKSSTQSINSVTTTLVTWDTEVYDTNTLHDNVTNNSRLTVQKAGKYLINGIIDFAASAIGIRQIILLKNGVSIAAVIYPNNGAGDPVQAQVSVLDYATATTDYYEMQVYQDSGGALNVASSSLYYFSCTLLGV